MLNADAFVNTQTFTEIAADKAKCPYTHSPFKVLKDMSSKKKGKFFERCMKSTCLVKDSRLKNLKILITIVRSIPQEIKGFFSLG